MARQSSRISLLLALAIVPAAIAACGGGGTDSQSGDKAVIGEIIGKSGWLNPFDLPPSQAAAIAVKDPDATHGVDFTIKSEDSQSDPTTTLQGAQRLLDEGAGILIASCNYEGAAPAARAANAREVVVFSYCGGEPILTRQAGGSNSFTFDMGNETNGTSANMADFASSQGYKAAFLLKDVSTNYSKQMCDFFAESWKHYPGTSIVGEDTFQNTDSSLASQVATIQSEKPDVIVLCSYLPGGATALRQIRAAGITTPVVTGDGMDGDSLFKSVPNLSEFYETLPASRYGDDPDPKVNSLVEQLTKQNGERPQSSYVVFGYSVIQALGQAINEAGTTSGPELRDALEQFDKVPLLVGPTSFSADQHVDSSRPQRIIQVQDGQASYKSTSEARYVAPAFPSG